MCTTFVSALPNRIFIFQTCHLKRTELGFTKLQQIVLSFSTHNFKKLFNFAGSHPTLEWADVFCPESCSQCWQFWGPDPASCPCTSSSCQLWGVEVHCRRSRGSERAEREAPDLGQGLTGRRSLGWCSSLWGRRRGARLAEGVRETELAVMEILLLEGVPCTVWERAVVAVV